MNPILSAIHSAALLLFRASGCFQRFSISSRPLSRLGDMPTVNNTASADTLGYADTTLNASRLCTLASGPRYLATFSSLVCLPCICRKISLFDHIRFSPSIK